MFLCFQKEAAASIHLAQYAIKGTEKDWTEALSGTTSSKGIISVKGSVFSNVFCDHRCQKMSYNIKSRPAKRERKRKKAGTGGRHRSGFLFCHFLWLFLEMLLYFLSAVSLSCSLCLHVSLSVPLLSLFPTLCPCYSEYKLTCCFLFSWSNLPFRNQFCCSCLPL